MKVGIVGSGFVGATAGLRPGDAAASGARSSWWTRTQARAEAEADDIRHAVPFAHPLDVRAGGYEDLAGCRAVVLCAGVGQKPGETRLQLLQRNAAVFREVVPAVLASAPDAVLVVATNPVDVMTHLAARYAAAMRRPRRPRARLRHDAGHGPLPQPARRTLRRRFAPRPRLRDRRARRLGGAHLVAGDRRRHAAGGVRPAARASICPSAVRQDIDAKVRGAAYTIISGKGATYYGIGSALARIVDVVLHDQRSILTVCAPTADVAGVQRRDGLAARGWSAGRASWRRSRCR